MVAVDASALLLDLLIILVSARIMGELFSHFGSPSVIGELLAGIIIGPSVLGFVELNEVITLLGEIGVILLLFEVGLETDMGKMLETGSKSFIVAVGGFIGPFVLGFLASWKFFELSLMESLFIGGTLTATSIGITARTLLDIGKQNSKEGQITLGAAVLDDILGVVLLALLYEFSLSGQVNWVNAFNILFFVALFFFLAPVLARSFSGLIARFQSKSHSPGLVPCTIVSMVLFFAWLAHALGAPEILGGFAAGLALSRRFFLPFGLSLQTDPAYSQKITREMMPIIHLFTPIFFVSVGLSMDLRDVDWTSAFFWGFSLIMLGIAIFSKYLGAMFINEPFSRRIVVGMSMVPRGEVGLIFAGLGVSSGIFDNSIYTAMIIVITYTTLLSPFWIKLYYRLYGHLLDEADRKNGTGETPVPGEKEAG